MKKVGVLTATRAEYGLLYSVIKGLQDADLETAVLVTGAHLSEKQGMTYKEIEKDGIHIEAKIPILTGDDTPKGISMAMANALKGFSEYFSEHHLDALVVLGDRYETLAVCCAAMNERIPIFHLYGGETTEGAIDEAIRHSITKMSYLHFTSTEEYRRRVIQLGEDPERVYNVGAIGVENIKKQKLLSKEKLETEINFSLQNPYAVVTFHPVTLEKNEALKQVEELLAAIETYQDMSFILTGANADAGGGIINDRIFEYGKERRNVFITNSLGQKKYFSALKYAEFVMGNSSSGIIEAPSFGIPTVNIGDRQKGRIKAESVIDCKPCCPDIIKAINIVRMSRQRGENIINPYEKENTTETIINVMCNFLNNRKIDLKKKFYDLK